MNDLSTNPAQNVPAIPEKGGWTREQLEAWGRMAFPLQHGWKRALERRYAAENGAPMRRAKILVNPVVLRPMLRKGEGT